MSSCSDNEIKCGKPEQITVGLETVAYVYMICSHSSKSKLDGFVFVCFFFWKKKRHELYIVYGCLSCLPVWSIFHSKNYDTLYYVVFNEAQTFASLPPIRSFDICTTIKLDLLETKREKKVFKGFKFVCVTKPAFCHFNAWYFSFINKTKPLVYRIHWMAQLQM